MKARLVRCAAAAALLLLLSLPGRAAAGAAVTTWFPKEFECPVCKTKNTFLVIGSFGSYIYQWPSKFEFIFWPYTDDPTVYSCKHCRLSAFMGDFEETPKDKHAEIRKRLEGVRLEPRKGGESATKYYKGAVYLDIPVSERLLAAQRVYEVLGRDEEFWGHFYRVLGHHFEAEKKQAEADEARRKALSIAQKMLADKKNDAARKELLLISGAMRHFLRDDPGALKDFREALKLKYQNKEMEEERARGFDEYLTALLREYVELIENPRKDGKKVAALGVRAAGGHGDACATRPLAPGLAAGGV